MDSWTTKEGNTCQIHHPPLTLFRIALPCRCSCDNSCSFLVSSLKLLNQSLWLPKRHNYELLCVPFHSTEEKKSWVVGLFADETCYKNNEGCVYVCVVGFETVRECSRGFVLHNHNKCSFMVMLLFNFLETKIFKRRKE
ncbi:hypothetical protein V8G54_034817 [Vigna mungo]|uniref:Uncharacterized protein n=1 Tax=Vigna mungo TaxID=3915 RepID=A0AAQ3MEK1_VIGMU